MDLLHILRLGHLGDGIAGDGSAHPLTLPGDQVSAGDGRLLIGSHAIRTEPVCAHFTHCGGCNLQHASDAFLARWKREVVVRALEARGMDAPLRHHHVSPPGSRRRAVFSGRRTKKTVQLGFHARASAALVPVTDCAVVLPDMLDLRPALEALVRLGASRKGEVKLTVTGSEAGWDVDVRDGKPMAEVEYSALAALVEQADLARLSWQGEVAVARRPPFQPMGAARVVPPPGAFLQATADGEAFLVQAVREAVGGAARVADLFCGCGTFALPLAAGAEVLAVEAEADYLAALDEGWRGAEGVKRVRTLRRDLFRQPLVANDFKAMDAVVLDPPRAGAEAQMRQVAGSDLAVVAAVSCNPVSFARDAAILRGAGFRLDWIDVVDQFRWSNHVELVARFSR